MNVLNKYILDPYTESKRVAEKKLTKSKCIILRLPLILDKTKKNYANAGQLKYIFNYLNFKFLPIYPMIYPGTKFDLVLLNDLSNFISKLVTQKKIIKKIYNLSGDKYSTMWNLFEEIAKIKGKRVFKIKIKFLNIILPNYFKKLLRRSPGLSKHLLMFNNTKLTTKRTILR
jgi:nucleoside-diphosphate-sugar epimerase